MSFRWTRNVINATILNVLRAPKPNRRRWTQFNRVPYDGMAACGLILTLITVMAAALKNTAFGATTVKENITSNIGLMTKAFDFGFRPLTVLSDVGCPTIAMFIGLLSS